MKKSFNIFMGLVTLITVSTWLTSCDGHEFSDKPLAAEKKSIPTDPTPDPSQPQTDSIGWKQAIQKYHRVEPTTDVTTVIIGQRNSGNLDSLVLKYKYIYSLAADTTIYLESAPTGSISFTADVEKIWFSEYSHNEQGDSICYINYAKPYTLSNGVNLSLTTQRVRGWHLMGGRPEMYSEPNQSVGRMSITSETTEFERNDSIFGLRTSVCSVPLTLGGVQFTASATIREIWFARLKETPEPHFDILVNENVSRIASSMVQVVPTNTWKNVHLMVGATKVHAIVCTTDARNANVVAIEDKAVSRSRVVVDNRVDGSLYDPSTGLYVPAILTPNKEGWVADGTIDSRHVEYDRLNAQLIDEGVKNFMETNTSKPTLTFSGVSAKVTATWKEYEYTTITWVKYSKEGKAYTNTIVVKAPKKA